jgi:uncharacterized protein (TIGR02466 family)
MDVENDLGGKQVWPTMLFHRKWSAAAEETASIVQFLYELRSQRGGQIDSGVAMAAKAAHGLFETDFELFKSDHAGVRKLVAWCEESVRKAVSVANGQRWKPDDLRVEIPDAWAHITNDGGHHDAHYHGGCSWCGIFYLQAGDVTPTQPTAAGNGVSRFYSPLPTGGILPDVGNAYLSSNRIDITPVDGLLVLFPAYLLHSGLPYKGERDRVVIAFNSRTYVKGRGG